MRRRRLERDVEALAEQTERLIVELRSENRELRSQALELRAQLRVAQHRTLRDAAASASADDLPTARGRRSSSHAGEAVAEELRALRAELASARERHALADRQLAQSRAEALELREAADARRPSSLPTRVLEDGERAHYEAQVEALRAHACHAAAEAERARADAVSLRAELRRASTTALDAQRGAREPRPDYDAGSVAGVGEAVAEGRTAARARPSAYDSEAAASRDWQRPVT